MTSYKYFLGIDIGKFSFFVAQHGNKKTKEYENSPLGVDQFLRDYKKQLPHALCVIEPTGGYELRLIMSLSATNYAVHRANPRQVKYFIRSHGGKAKTDNIDAQCLSLYAYERASSLELFELPSEEAMNLYELVQRRRDLRQMLVAEKNRHQSPRQQWVKDSIKKHIDLLTEEIEQITQSTNEMIKKEKTYREKKKIIMGIPGIGEIIANELLVMIPELGRISRRQIASLVGVAPIANESGRHKGYRRTGYGREGIKPMLYLAAMAARNSNSQLKSYYQGLVERGKSKMVALTALMRKIIVIANAKLKEC